VPSQVREFLFNRVRLNSSRVYLDAFAREAAESVRPGARVLDAGAGRGPYRKWFPHVEYESADVVRSPDPDSIHYVSDLSELPVEDARYDLILMTQVLEHVPEPTNVLREVRRVLRPGGAVWLSAPLFYEEHDQPHDYFRYTQFGLRRLLDRADLQVERVEWLEGYLGTFAYQIDLASRSLPVTASEYGGGTVGRVAAVTAWLLRPALFLLAAAAARLDVRHRHTAAGLCKNWCVVAIRPAD
jgi:SAM-dependent methyltransferase